MNKKLHVGNLSYETTEDQLQQLFVEVGPVVSTTIIRDTGSGRSRGFGFVEMETEQAAQQAIERLNNHAIDERTITVNEAHPPRERSFGTGGGRSGAGGNRRPRGGGTRY